MYSLIFRGRRLVELHKWRNSIVPNASSFFNSFSSDVSPPQDCRNGKISGVDDSFSLTRKLAESNSSKASSEGKGGPDSVLSLFRSHGFIDAQISRIVTLYPELLTEDAEKSLAPKLQFLQSREASSSTFTYIVASVPKMLGLEKKEDMGTYYDLIKAKLEADKNAKLKKLYTWPPGKEENIITNVGFLHFLGVPPKRLYSMITWDYKLFSGGDEFQDSVADVLNMGFDPTKRNFVEALKVIYLLSDEDTREETVNVYTRSGFAVEDVWSMFKKFPRILALSENNILNSIETYIGLGFTRDELTMMVKRHPACIAYSTEMVKKKAEFLVKKMNWPLAELRPEIFSYSMENRIVPRCNVITALMSKGMIGSKLPSVSSVLVCTNEVFLNRYVRKHDDKELVAELMAIFTAGDD